ncbi:MAG TPA: hypothetical protein DCE42_10035 [Myxococcales bacterium]|nr:hypothetical protein [Myxococcales bacterium]
MESSFSHWLIVLFSYPFSALLDVHLCNTIRRDMVYDFYPTFFIRCHTRPLEGKNPGLKSIQGVLMSSFQHSTWDSTFFDRSVFIIRDIDVADLASGVRHCREQGAALLFVFVTQPLAQTFAGWRVQLVDQKVTYTHSLVERSTPMVTPGVVELPLQLDESLLASMLPIAFDIGRWTRFAKDKYIAEETWKELYTNWVINSLRGEMADHLLAVFRERALAGFATARCKGEVLSIPLVGVGKEHRREGIGRLLLEALCALRRNRAVRTLEVVTQKENEPACRLYESCGFTKSKVEYVYHFWTDSSV